MAYTKTNWIDGTTPLSAYNLNHAEQGIADNDTQLADMSTQKADESALMVERGRIDGIVTSAGDYYIKCLQTDTGALLVVESEAITGQINLADITPKLDTYTPIVGDYVRLVSNGLTAETSDMRISDDGTIYNTAGDAVRDNFSKVKGALTLIEPTNWIDFDSLTAGYNFNLSGEIVVNANASLSDFIPCINGNVFKLYGSVFTLINALYWVGYDAYKNVVAGSATSFVSTYTVSNESIKYIRFSLNTSYLTGLQTLAKNSYVPTTHTDYFIPYYECIDGNAREDITELQDSIANLSIENIELVLPSIVPLSIGSEMNIYYDNIIKGTKWESLPKLFFVKPQTDEYVELNNRMVINPTTVRDLTKNVNWNNGKVNKTSTIRYIHVTPKASGTISIISIGDSKVEYNHIISQTLQELFTAAGVTCSLLGTRGTTYKDEGRAGWSTNEYCNSETYGGVSNAFYNPSTSNFDFAYYMSQQGYTGVDVVNINLGTNDVWHITDGVYTEDDVIARYNEIVASIHAYDPNIIICIGLTENTCQFTLNDYTDTQGKDRILYHCQKLIEEFDNRQGEKIFLTPLYINMDLMEDYNFSEVPLSARDTVKTRKYPTDRVHQSTIGFQKNADTMYATIEYALSLQV